MKKFLFLIISMFVCVKFATADEFSLICCDYFTVSTEVVDT